MSNINVDVPVEDQTASEADAAAAVAEPSYGHILKSSALIGGSQVLTIAVGIVRAKAMAMLLGPAGFGLSGLYGSIINLGESVAGMGISSSGVRQIAEAAGSAHGERIGRTVVAVRQACIALAIIGAALLAVFSPQVSDITFGDHQHSVAVALISLAVFFRVVSSGQAALIQGMRRISDLARLNVLGALLGTAIAIPLVYMFRERGLVWSLVAVAGMSLVTSWWYSRNIKIQSTQLTGPELRHEISALLRLGAAFMASGLMTMGAAYIVRITILRQVGFEATGFYQAAWTVGGLYVGFILQAMGADFYPRLTACANNNVACNRLVNEQLCVGLLLGGPGVILTLTCAPIVITLFYSPKFYPAVEILRWICLGVALRMITWPMGFIIMAKGKTALVFWTEFAWTLVNVTLTWLCVGWFGLSGAGIGFFASYIFHGCLLYPIVRRLSGFSLTLDNRHIGALFMMLVGVAFCGFSLLPFTAGLCVGLLAAIVSGLYAIRRLLKLMSHDSIPRPIGRVLTALRLHA